MTNNEIMLTDSKVLCHSFSTRIADLHVAFEVVKFPETLYLWIGDEKVRTFNELAYAIQGNSMDNPLSTKIMGQTTDITSSAMATKLSKKLKKPVYVSLNLVGDRLMMPEVNKRLAEEIKSHPDCF